MATPVRVTARREIEYDSRAYRVGDVFEVATPLEAAALARTGAVTLEPGNTVRRKVLLARGRQIRRRNTYQRRDLVAEPVE